jgi:hypothetical protein
MNIIIVSAYGSDISSRARAAQLRQMIVSSIENDHFESVDLDFSGVRTISESFADELFAVLVDEKGEDWFRLHVKVTNLDPLPRNTVLQAIAERLHETA